MPKNVQEYCNKILELVEELESVHKYKDKFDQEHEKIFQDYQKGRFGFFKYEKLLKQTLKGKTKKEWDEYYNHQIFHLLKRIEYLNSQAFYTIYQEKEPRIEIKAEMRQVQRPIIEEKPEIRVPEEIKPSQRKEMPKPVQKKEDKPKIDEFEEEWMEIHAPAEKKKEETTAEEKQPMILPEKKEKISWFGFGKKKEAKEEHIAEAGDLSRVYLPEKEGWPKKEEGTAEIERIIIESKEEEAKKAFAEEKKKAKEETKEKPEFKIPLLERLARKEKPQLEELEEAVTEEMKPKIIEMFPKTRARPEIIAKKAEELKKKEEKRPIVKTAPEMRAIPPAPKPVFKIEPVIPAWQQPKTKRPEEEAHKIIIPQKKTWKMPEIPVPFQKKAEMPSIPEPAQRMPVQEERIPERIEKRKGKGKKAEKEKVRIEYVEIEKATYPAPEQRIEQGQAFEPRPEEGKIKITRIIKEKEIAAPRIEEKEQPAKTRKPIVEEAEVMKPYKIPIPGKEKYEKKTIEETKFVVKEEKVPFWKKIIKPRSPYIEGEKPALPEFKKEKQPEFLEKKKVTFASKVLGTFGLKKKSTKIDEILEEERRIEKGEGAVKVGGPVSNMVTFFMRKIAMKDTPDKKKKKLIEKDMRIRFLRTGTTMEKESLEHISGGLIKKEARRIQEIMTKQKQLKLYKPTLLGTIANVSVRDISYSLVDIFPDFFRQLYNNMRLANIKILSNTYVNMMIFSTMVTTLLSLIVLPTLFYMQGNSIALAITKALIFAIIAGSITFLAFYAYPMMRIKDRRRSIKTNLPFALNHMAAVASSGVPPNVLFRLISSSKEYGEICIESEKINQFVTIFGYDLLSAMKNVAETTPSKEFKDFLDGMISTIESGGNLEEFLSEQSKEALLSYELDRQKYTETIATYSDIYTGLLIAAPLFFVAALSLISILGGGIGGVSVDVIISVGTYLVLPILNIIFIVFLEITQPEF